LVNGYASDVVKSRFGDGDAMDFAFYYFNIHC
jgi:hypothetical protein